MKTLTVTVVVVALTYGAWYGARSLEALGEKYAQEGSGGGQPSRANIRPPEKSPPPPPVSQQEVKTDVGIPKVKMESDGTLVPTDPEERRKSELGIFFGELGGIVYYLVWGIPVIGCLVLALMRGRRNSKQGGISSDPALTKGGTAMKALTAILVIAGLTYGTWHIARHNEHLANRYEQEGTGWTPGRVSIPAPHEPRPTPPPVEQQLEIVDEPLPVKMLPDGTLVPTDPEEQRKCELAIQHREISNLAYMAVWVVPVVGIILAVLGSLHRFSIPKGGFDAKCDHLGGDSGGGDPGVEETRQAQSSSEGEENARPARRAAAVVVPVRSVYGQGPAQFDLHFGTHGVGEDNVERQKAGAGNPSLQEVRRPDCRGEEN